MPRHPTPRATEAGIQILEALWRQGRSTVRLVHDTVALTLATIVLLAAAICVGLTESEAATGPESAKRGETAAMPKTSSEGPWGESVAGLQCRVKAPGRLEQGMALEAEIELRIAPQQLPPGVKRLNRFLADASLELTLLDPRTKVSVTVRPYDPTFGMPVHDKGKQVDPLDKGPPRSLQTSFPLATVWSTLKPGTYETRVRYSFPGGYQKSWWRGAPGQWEAIWKGTIASGPVTLEVLPATQKMETLLLPRHLRLLPGLKVGYTKEDAEKVDVPRRNGFVIGTSIARGPARGFSLQGAAMKPDDVNPIDQLLGDQGGVKRLSYTITVFETADRTEHMWHPGPGSGGYRELWKKTLELSPSEKELRESAGGTLKVEEVKPQQRSQ